MRLKIIFSLVLSWLRPFVQVFWMPALFMFVWLFYLSHLGIASDASQQIVLGIVLGTSLGFIADLFKRSIDSFRQDRRIRITARTLLAQDALSVFKTMEMMKRATESAPQEVKDAIKNSLPIKLDLHYWKYLTSERDFVLLASEEPFASWYKRMFSWEKMNEMIDEGRKQIEDPNLKDKVKPMAAIAHAAYYQTIRDDDHKKFALEFFSEDELQKSFAKPE